MKNKKFIEVHVQNHIISHGFDSLNKEILEEVQVDKPSKKLIAIDRILSVSEKYILTSYASGRIIYWEYQETLEEIRAMLME